MIDSLLFSVFLLVNSYALKSALLLQSHKLPIFQSLEHGSGNQNPSIDPLIQHQ